MGILKEYDDNVEYCRTQQELLPTGDKENLDVHRPSKKPKTSSRSVLGQVENSENIPGVLKQHGNTTTSTDKVSWSDVVRGNL